MIDCNWFISGFSGAVNPRHLNVHMKGLLMKLFYVGNAYVPAANGTLASPELIFHRASSFISVSA